jgi:hypothetical protein
MHLRNVSHIFSSYLTVDLSTFIRKTSELTLEGYIDVCGKNNIKLTNIFSGQNVEILMLKQMVSIATSELDLIIF